jgi:predicted CXXCH cytochrome family protein
MTTGCHSNAHGSDNDKLLAAGPTIDQFCYNCHTQGKVMNDAISNNRTGGYVSADDIEEAFNKSVKHNLGTSFEVGGNTFTLQCTTCHNPHVATGQYWDAEYDLTPITRPDFSDPINNPRAMGTEAWGDESGEKMDDFAAQGSGSGGWYYSVARGGVIVWDQAAVYQPPKDGSGWDYEFYGDVLPDYTTLCLDCHTHRMSAGNPPVNWGQGIACTDNSVDPPNQRIECGAQHGLGSANKPNYWGGDAGFFGSSGNPDPIFNEPNVTRGRGAGHFMRWPYDSAYRSAGINFVMACTDCHEAHGSNRGGIVRERFNVNANGDCGTGGNPNPDGENCSDGGNWNSYCNACHYYYGGQHAGMSCGNASCHEANSPHRIIHVTHSGGTNLWQEPSRPTYTPEIASVQGEIDSYDLMVTFTEGVWTNMDQTGALGPWDFLLTDVNNDNPRDIESVTHTPGDSTAIVTMTEPLASGDSLSDLLATLGISVWSAGGYPAGPWPMTMAGCPVPASFQLNELAGSATITDESGLLIGTVGADPYITMPGTGVYHGDEDLDTYIDIDNENAKRCMLSPRALTLEARIYPTEVDSDFGDGSTPTACTRDLDCGPLDGNGDPTALCSCGRDTRPDPNDRCDVGTGGCDLKPGYYYDCTYNYSSNCPTGETCCPNAGEGCWNNSGFCTTSTENATFSRVFHRHRNIMVTVIHTDYRGDSRPDRANKASIEVKYFVDAASRHTCPHPLWPTDPYNGNDARWHQISSSIGWCLTPMISFHRYTSFLMTREKPGWMMLPSYGTAM